MESRLLKKSIFNSYANAFFYSIGEGIVPLSVTLSYFISQYSDSTVLYGVMLGLSSMLVYFPKFFISKIISKSKNSFKILFGAAFAIRILWLILGVFVLTLREELVLIAFFVIYLLISLSRSVWEVAYIQTYANVIPKKIRGRFFGYQYFIVSVGALIGSIIGFHLMKLEGFPYNYGLVFIVVSLLGFISYIFLIRVKKVAADSADEKVEFTSYIKELKITLKNDKEFRYLVISQVFATLGGTMTGYYAMYAKDVLNFGAKEIASLSAFWIGSKLIFSIIWGYVSDKFGVRVLLILSRVVIISGYLVISLVKVDFAIYIVFILYGISGSGLVVSKDNAFMLLGREKRSIYAGITALINSPISMLMPIIVSYLIDSFGYQLIFAFSIIPLIIAIWVLSFKSEF